MNNRHATLLSNISATGAGSWTQYTGGRSVLEVVGTFGAAVPVLQKLGKDGTSTVIVGTVATTGTLTSFDLPIGQYRMILTGGTPSGIYADLTGVGYDG